MRTAYYSLVLALMLVMRVSSVTFDLSKTNKHGAAMISSMCNKDTVLDFNLSPQTTISCNPTCTVTNPQKSQMRFLDVGGSEESYSLVSGETGVYAINGAKTRSYEESIIKLAFESASGKKLYVGIPFRQTIGVTDKYPDQLNLNKIEDTAFTTLKSVPQPFPLSGLNYLNRRQFGHFYHLANNAQNPTITYLLAYFVLGNLNITSASLTSSAYDFPLTNASFVLDDNTYASTGDKLCWGSESQGIFQTHLRESYPLWAAWLGILFYWLYNLISNSNEINCYDKNFEDNKWTCWGLYSLNRLGHEDYFTKLSRSTMMLITFSWQGCVLAVLYSQIEPGKGSVMILWAAVIAIFTAMPFTYAMGYIFLRKIYELTLRKYETLKKMKGVFNKKDSSMQGYERDVDNTEQALYGYYYWFYVLAFCFFTVFWVIAVRQMMQISRDYYYFMYYWLASLGVTLGFEHLFFDPILTFLFGNMDFYRFRGFFYDFRLGQMFKEIQE